MNKLTVTTILATTVLSTSAFAGTLVGPAKDTDTKTGSRGDVIAEFKGTRFGAFLDTDVLPPKNENPPPACSKDSSKLFNLPLYEQTSMNIPFSLGVAAEVGLVTDSTKVGARLSLGPSVELFGNVGKPIDFAVTAAHTSAGMNSLDFSIFLFGKQIATENIAATAAPLQYIDSMGWNLPNFAADPVNDDDNDGVPDDVDPNQDTTDDEAGGINFGDSWGCPSLGSDVRNCRLGWSLKASGVADLGAAVVLRVSSNGVEARALIASNAFGSVKGTAYLHTQIKKPYTDKEEWFDANVDLEAHANIDIMRLVFGGRAVLTPQSGAWLADAGGSISIIDAMGADLGYTFPVPFHDDLAMTILDLEPIEWADDWKYRCTYATPTKTLGK